MSHDTVVLAASGRDVTENKPKHLRQEGVVPGVIYDHGKTTHVQVNDREFSKAFQTVGRSQPIELDIAGKKQLAMIKQIDLHPVRHTFRHVAFLAIKRNEKVAADVQVRLKLEEGNEATPAERAGLIVLRALETVAIKALPKDLPEELYVDGEKLVESGDQVTIGDVELPKGVEFADAETDMEQTIATAYEPSAIAAANEATGGDAEDDNADDVDAEHGEDTPQDTQDGEQMPGGKGQDEPKPSSIESDPPKHNQGSS